MKKRKHGKSRSLSIVQKYAPDVREVRDGSDDIEVEVTKRDIAVARRRGHDGCAMAVAGTRAARADGMIVGIDTAYVVRGKVAYRYKLPTTVSREITSFDRGSSFEPGIYQLNRPCESILLGSSKHARGGHSRELSGKVDSPAKYHHTQNIRVALQSEKKGRS